MSTLTGSGSTTDGQPPSRAGWQDWQLAEMRLEPDEEWQRMREFVRFGEDDVQAITRMIEPLVKHQHAVVEGIYEHLQRDHEMALILGWENRPDDEQLGERRRALTLWLSRTIGLDLGDDFAYYLFDIGQRYAGYGPGEVRVPERYVIGMMSLIYAGFLDVLVKELPVDEPLCRALLAWNKLLNMQTALVLAGYHSACELTAGDNAVRVSLLGAIRETAGTREVTVHVPDGSCVETVLRRLFEFRPQLRGHVLNSQWVEGSRDVETRTPTLVVQKGYTLQPGRRVMLNGRDLATHGGPTAAVKDGDEIGVY